MSSATEFGNVLVEELKGRGFAPIGRSGVMGAIRGEICDVFFIHKSKWDDSIQLVVGAWHPTLSTLSGRSLAETIKGDILGGDLSPWGVGEEKWWRLTEEGSLDLFRRCISLGFRWLSPVRTLSDLSELAQFGSRKIQTSSASASFPKVPLIPQELECVQQPRRFTETEHRIVLRVSLTSAFKSLGFQVRETKRQFAFVRERGEFLDVIEPRNVSWGMHTVLNCFVTTLDIGKVRPEVSSLLLQTNGGEIGPDGFSRGIRAIETSALDSTDFADKLSELVRQEALPFLEMISTREDFLRTLGMGWEGTIGQPLGKFWNIPLHR